MNECIYDIYFEVLNEVPPFIPRITPKTSPALRQMYEDVIEFSIPRLAYEAYCVQKQDAKKRGVAWEFNLPAWWAWWQIDGNWMRRGNRRGQLLMARYRDLGPYRPDNVFCTTPSGNMRDRDRAKTSEFQKEAHARRVKDNLVIKGGEHHRARSVHTPAGRFGSVTEAAIHHRLTPAAASARARKGTLGWRYENVAPERVCPPPHPVPRWAARHPGGPGSRMT